LWPPSVPAWMSSRRHQGEHPLPHCVPGGGPGGFPNDLDAMGADKLLGKGDMLYLPPGSGRLIRAQGALVTDQEIQSVVDFILQTGQASYEMEIHQQLQKTTPSGFDGDAGGGGDDEDESLIEQCIEIIRRSKKPACPCCSAACASATPARPASWMNWRIAASWGQAGRRASGHPP